MISCRPARIIARNTQYKWLVFRAAFIDVDASLHYSSDEMNA